MSITEDTVRAIQSNQNPLPRLIKQSSTYKMIVPKKVEEKIRYLLRKFPHTEWSGVLFIKHTGGFETDDLVITCEDLYPMDLGTSGWTEFQMNEDVTAYMAENIELFECDLALCHSHHAMGAWFSGQDTKTLQVEGNDTNCFVSLIVDTLGTYQAAITRKIQAKKQIITHGLGKSYEFFGSGEVHLNAPEPTEEVVVDDAVIEYFMLDVEVEPVDNPLDYLDVRFEEIEAKKKAEKPALPNTIKAPVVLKGNDWSEEDKDDDKKEFFSWIHSNRKESAEAKEKLLFTEEEMGEVDYANWEPDPAIIHHLACQLITCSLIVNPAIDLKQWIVRHMEKEYDEIFDMSEFQEWSESYVEFIINHYSDGNAPADLYDDMDFLNGKVAEALFGELGTYPTNYYITEYQDVLYRYY